MTDMLPRASAFDGLDLAAPPLDIAAQPHCARHLYWGGVEAAAALGLELPGQPLRVVRSAGRAALWLGPEEYLVLGALTTPSAAPSARLVDISHRQAALRVSGPWAAAALNAGCPLDLDLAAFAVDGCTRTLFGKAEILLWRVAVDCFHIEAGRSFIPYVVALLREAARGLD